MRAIGELAAGLRPAAALLPAAPEAGADDADGEAAPAGSPLGALVYRPGLWRRNALAYATVRRWRAESRGADLAAFKRLKADLDGRTATVAAIAGELADFAGRLLGAGEAGLTVVNVAGGHSRSDNCLSKRLARGVAGALGARFCQAFADRPCSGVSHPKEYRKLPPLTVLERPGGTVLLVDDVATSGWHLEEAAGVLRQTAPVVLALAWIGGTVGAVGG